MGQDIAVLVDAENVGAQHWPQLRRWLAGRGRLGPTLLIGDFSSDTVRPWLEIARREGLTPVLQLRTGKNSADIALAIAAMDLLHEGRHEAFCIASSDRDLLPVVARLRRAGREVYLARCRGDVSLEGLVTDVVTLGAPSVPAPAPVDRLRQAVEDALGGERRARLSQVAARVREVDPSLLRKGKAKATLAAQTAIRITREDDVDWVSLTPPAA